MARKKSSKSPASIAYDFEQAKCLDNPFDQALEAAVDAANELKHFSGDVFSATGSLAQLICLKMPALAPRFLLQSEGWPLGRFIMIDGFQESCKSSLGYEIGTWHRQATGNMTVVETEQKDAADLRDSFFNYDRKAWKHHRARTQQGWNQAVNWWADQLKAMMDARGRVSPFMIMVDSMSAVLIDAQQKHIDEHGSAEQNHPIHAKLLADFFRAITKKIIGYPISLVAVNHLKMSQVPGTSIQQRNTTGGSTPKFQMTTEIEMRRRKAGQGSRSHPKYGEVFNIDIGMFVRKNSLASKEEIGVEMCWYFDPDDIDPITNSPRQKTYFDWNSASIELLLDCMLTGDSGKGFYKKRTDRLYDLIDLHGNVDRRQVWSNVLGISENSKLSYYEAGKVLEAKIQSNQEFATELYNILGIRRRFMFQPGIDMQEQIRANKDRLDKIEAENYKFAQDTSVDSGIEQPIEEILNEESDDAFMTSFDE